MIGLYALGIKQSKGAIGPIACMVAFLVATIVWHVMLNRHIAKMDRTLPDELVADQAMHNGHGAVDVESHPNGLAAGNTNEYSNGEMNYKTSSPDGVEGLLYAPGHQKMPQETKANKVGIMGRIKGFLKPKAAASHHIWSLAPHLSTPVRAYTPREHMEAFMHPAAVSEPQTIWIARDEYGLSKKEVHDSKERIGEGFEMTDEGAWLNAKGKVEWEKNDVKRAPIWEDEPIY